MLRINLTHRIFHILLFFGVLLFLFLSLSMMQIRYHSLLQDRFNQAIIEKQAPLETSINKINQVLIVCTVVFRLFTVII